MPSEDKGSESTPTPDADPLIQQTVEQLVEIPLPTVELVGHVKYTYSSVAQVITTIDDVRIAFGDRLPPDGRVEPLFGVTMSHVHAKRFIEALTKNLAKHDRIQDRLGKEKPLSLPFDPTTIKGLQIPPEGSTYTSVKFRLKDGTERIVQGAELTHEVRRWVDTLLAAHAASEGNEQKLEITVGAVPQ